MNSFSGLQIGLSALISQQLLQETIAHNVANVNTPGFSRQKARLVALPPSNPYSLMPQTGLGVAVADVRRSASVLLNRQIERESGTLTYWSTVRDGMSEVQSLFLEPGSLGLQAIIDEFWASWRDLSVDPTNPAARATVRQAGETLASNIQRAYQGVSNSMTQLDAELGYSVGRVNLLAGQIAALNKQIQQAVAAGDPANDLRDQRDMLLQQMSTLARVQSGENSDGTLLVIMGGHIIVGASGATPIDVRPGVDGFNELVWSDDGSNVVVREGEIGAKLGLRDWAQNQVLADLDRMAAALIQSVNGLHEDGYTPPPANRTDISFFSGTGAGDIRVSDEVKADLDAIAVAASPNSPGDASVALQIAGLQRQESAALNDTVGGFYAGFVARLGLNVQQADNMVKSQDSLVQFLNASREDLAGVSLDEEAVQMLGAQRAYQAASRVITAVDEMLDRLINNTGLVGR
ncbi:MAG: flagellar hook-associated protein FlgK [Anaerolineae bacterium]|nr:flagellar hook-associated protein FlgK [Anaerolineae bacterium]